MKRVIKFYEVFDEEEAAIRKHLKSKFKASFTKKTIQESKDKAPAGPIICVRTQSVIPSAWAKSLEAIFTRSQGFDHLRQYLHQTQASIECGYLGSYCAKAVAEQAVLMSLMLLRKIKTQLRNFDSFHRNGMTGYECQNKNAFVVGVGGVGKEIVQMSCALGMNVRGNDPMKNNKKIEYTSLNKGIKWANVIFCAADLNSSSKNLLNYRMLSRSKPGTILVNVSRGEITPIGDLKRLLDQKILGGIALDVFPEESELADYLHQRTGKITGTIKIALELKARDNVIFTPHNAFNTREALERKARETIRALEYYLKHEHFPNRLENKF